MRWIQIIYMEKDAELTQVRKTSDLQAAHVKIRKDTKSRDKISNHIGSGVDFKN